MFDLAFSNSFSVFPTCKDRKETVEPDGNPRLSDVDSNEEESASRHTALRCCGRMPLNSTQMSFLMCK